jgi:hypothetical protein
LKFFPLRRSGSAFVQSGFYEVALSPALRAMLCHATSQNPPDSGVVGDHCYYDVGVGLQNNQLPCTEIGEAFGPFRVNTGEALVQLWVNTGELYWPCCGFAPRAASGIKSKSVNSPLQKQAHRSAQQQRIRNEKGQQERAAT